VVSWLVSFGVVDTRNRLVWSIGDFLYRATEPALRPIRNILPDLGGIDFSPLLLILLLIFTQRILNSVLIAVITRSWQPVIL
jgi:YggT family protein